MFWFDKENPLATFIDNREYGPEKLSNGQTFEVRPDTVMDFRAMDFPDESFYLVFFDPPHLLQPGPNGWARKKYGALEPGTWEEDLRKVFAECFRVLKPYGTLVLKWNEEDIPTKKILALTPYKPLVGHLSGKASKTHWITFMKIPNTPAE